MNGRDLALGVVAGLAVAGALSRRRGSRSEAWTVADTDTLVRALDALRPAAYRWATMASASNKEAVLDAYARLSEEERQALEKAVRVSWATAGFPDRRPLFRTPSRYEAQHPQGPVGGLSLSHKPTSGRAYVEPDERTRVFLVAPEEVALDSRVPNIAERDWAERFNAWDPPTYDRRGHPVHRRAQMSMEASRLFGRSPLWTPEWGAEDEVILRADANPPEMSYRAYVAQFGETR